MLDHSSQCLSVEGEKQVFATLIAPFCASEISDKDSKKFRLKLSVVTRGKLGVSLFEA